MARHRVTSNVVWLNFVPGRTYMLIDEATELLGERVSGGATLATSNDDWITGFATEIGIVVLLIIWLVSVVTKPFRRIGKVPINPFDPYHGTVYLALTDSRIAFFAVKQTWLTTELGPLLVTHPRSRDVSMSRTGRMITLQIDSDHAYSLFWMDSQCAWQQIARTLNCEQTETDTTRNAK